MTGLVVALPFGLGVAAAPADDAEPLFRFQDPEIVESSGLAVVDDLVVTVNDSGDEARLFTVDPATGATVGVTSWEGGAADVEALAPAGDSRVWVGDIGDNSAVRDRVAAVRVPVGPLDRAVAGQRVTLAYPAAPADAEALLAHPVTGRLVVVTKSLFGGQVFLAPRSLDPQVSNRLRPAGRVMPVVTDGAFFPDGRHLVLRDYSRARVYTWPGLEPVGELELPEQQQGEGIAVTPEGRLLVSTEGARAPVHEVDLPNRVEQAMAAPSEAGSRASQDEDATPGRSPGTRSREGSELPDQDPGPRDPTQWLIGTGLLVVAVVVLWRALRPR